MELASARARIAQQSRSIAEVSHDLRQPMHAIALFIGALRERSLDAETSRLVDRLASTTLGLDDLFRRLLDLGRLDSGSIRAQVSSFSLQLLLRTVVARYAPLAEARSLRWRTRDFPDLWIRSDPALLTELLMNLVTNALRYTSRGSIMLSVRRRKEHALIQVWDTGPGIPEKDLDRIFEEFVRLKPQGAKHPPIGGLGLGLAVVRRLANILGCAVEVRSRVGRGTVFSVRVPLVVAPDMVIARRPALCRDTLHGALILLVDDHRDTLEAAHALLRNWGCFVLLARDVREAVEQVEKSPRFPDAILTDHHLGQGESSFDVVTAVGAGLPEPVPVFVISADSSGETRRVTEEAGWTFVSKPIDASGLRSLLESRLAGRDEIRE